MEWRRKFEWNLGSLDWRVAALFMVGALLFAVGSFPLYATRVDVVVVAATFAVGSVFFTSAAYSQYLTAINPAGDDRAEFRFWVWQPRELLWWAVVVQLLGTVFFNISTFAATATSLTTQQAEHLVWAPDLYGSIAFLLASSLAWLAVCHRVWCVQRANDDWWIAVFNYAGSIFFMTAALGAFILPTTGEVANITLVNLGTFAGAICFFVGAYLLLPPQLRRPEISAP
jgi:hypothetical protein